MEIVFFSTPRELRSLFRRHHKTTKELWIGFHKKHTDLPSVTWPESVDEALCVGWIDGIRKRIDATSYVIRFTPRRVGSIWSAVNMRRVEVLIAESRMQPAGLLAFAARKENKIGIYSYEQRSAELPEPYAGILRQNRKAQKFFASQPPSYRKQVGWWVVSAKQEATRQSRLAKLILESEHGRRL
jgi:uncharacterized protein YdeI (YjbR/CyaY-like superfamily)